MSQHNAKNTGTRKAENERPIYPLTYPEDDWFTVVMIAVGIVTLIGYIVLYALYSH